MKKMGSNSLKVLSMIFMNVVALYIAQGENIRSIDWMLEESSYSRLCSTKKILTVNGMFPGPALRLLHGERVQINVHNHGRQEVSIHWRGVRQIRNPWLSELPENGRQSPIKPGSNFTYEITFSDDDNLTGGTLWWHADTSWSRATVHGPIFVYPMRGRQFPYPAKPDAEFSIVIGLWYKGDLKQIIQEATKFDAVTINGQPGDIQSCSTKDMLRMTVEAGKIYLLRILNAAMDEEMLFAVAKHKLVVVGIDASRVKPFSTNVITIAPNQTMDVLLTTNQPRNHYYMVARAFGGIMATAVVQYAGDYTPPINATFPTLTNSDHGGVENYSKFNRVY